MFKYFSMVFIGILMFSANPPLHSQVCCVQPASEVSTADKAAGDTGFVGEAFYATLSGSINFNGNWVGESTASPGSNSCWWPQSTYPQYPGLSGGSVFPPTLIVSTWPIAGVLGDDQYGDDFIELNNSTLVAPIRQHFAAQYAATPGWACTITLHQQMNYSCTGEGGNYQPYWDNTINFVVYINKIQFSRGTASATIYY